MIELCGSVEDQIQSSTRAVFVKVLVKVVDLQPNLTHIVNKTATVDANARLASGSGKSPDGASQWSESSKAQWLICQLLSGRVRESRIPGLWLLSVVGHAGNRTFLLSLQRNPSWGSPWGHYRSAWVSRFLKIQNLQELMKQAGEWIINNGPGDHRGKSCNVHRSAVQKSKL